MTSFVINKAKKTYDFDDGTSAPIPEDAFSEVAGKVAGKTPEAHARKEAFKKGLEKRKEELGNIGLGSLSTFASQAAPSILSAPADYLSAISDAYLQKSKGKSNLSFWDQVVDNYYAQKDAQKEFKEKLIEKEPVASYLGKAAGLAGEIAATSGIPAVAAAPILGFANSSTSILEPGNIIKEGALDAATGLVLDKAIKGLSNLAGRRGARQAEQAAIKDIEASNAARTKATEIANADEAARFSRENAARQKSLNELPANLRSQVESQLPPVSPMNIEQPVLEPLSKLPKTPAQTFANFLEDTKILDQLKSFKGILGTTVGGGIATSLGKMAGIPVGTIGTVAGTGFGAIKALTSYSAAGKKARAALKQGLLSSYLSSRAQEFPSFREGILDDPNDRRMFSRLVEDDPSLSLEDKAMIQTQVNRGQPLK